MVAVAAAERPGPLAMAVTAAKESAAAKVRAVAAVDVTVVAEQPRIAPHRDAMRAALAPALGIGIEDVSVKGKTNEGMGWIGRGEGIACLAAATLVRARERAP